MIIETNKIVKESVEVESPYYYEHDLSDEKGWLVVYGKMEPCQTTTVEIADDRYGNKTFKLEIDRSKPCGSYLKKEYKSSRVEFETAVQKMKDGIKKHL